MTGVGEPSACMGQRFHRWPSGRKVRQNDSLGRRPRSTLLPTRHVHARSRRRPASWPGRRGPPGRSWLQDAGNVAQPQNSRLDFRSRRMPAWYSSSITPRYLRRGGVRQGRVRQSAIFPSSPLFLAPQPDSGSVERLLRRGNERRRPAGTHLPEALVNRTTQLRLKVVLAPLSKRLGTG